MKDKNDSTNKDRKFLDPAIFENTKIIDVDIEKEMKTSFMAYTMSVIVARALPDVRDGLKPVHRRILYTMFENGLYPEKPTIKCADTVGAVLGRYHPHGDSSVYDALVRLAQDFSMRYPLVYGQGNFGSIDGFCAAAYRYTEAKLSKISMELLSDINKNTVNFAPNYDDRLQEPTVLPSRFPNLIVNGSTGIAVGMVTKIPSHNLREVVDGINMLIDNPDCTLDELMEIIKGPDFPTGGIIMGRAAIRAAYATGRAKIILRARTEIEEIDGRQCIVITEIPYMVNKSELVKGIADLHKEKRIEGIHFLRDESDRDGMRIVVEIKKDANAQIILNKLFSYSMLQVTFGVNMLALVNGEPKTLSLKQMLEEYLKFQVEIIRRRTEFDLAKANERAIILEGFAKALDFIDQVIDIIRSSETQTEAKNRLCEELELLEVQAEAIAQMRLIQLTGMERRKILDELDMIHAKIAEYKELLADERRIYEVIRTDLLDIKERFGDERRTDIQTISGEMDIEDLIPVEESVITYTNNGYIKRMAVDAYKTQKRGGRGVTGMKQREEDFIDEMFIASSHDIILFITNKGVMYKTKCYELPEGSKASRGTNIVNILQLSEGEKIAALLKIDSFDDGKYICIFTKAGKIKRTALSQYSNVRKRGIIAIGLDDGDEIAGVRLTDGTEQLLCATSNGAIIRFDEQQIRPCGRSAHGVRAITLRDGDYVVSAARVREGASVLTVTDKGLGRRTELTAYRMQNRGGYGTLNYKVSDLKGHVCGIKVVDDNDDVVLISNDGIIIRIRATDIRIMGRYATGVKVMKLSDEESRVVAFTRTVHDDSAEIAAIEQPSDEELAQEELAAKLEESAEVITNDAPLEDD